MSKKSPHINKQKRTQHSKLLASAYFKKPITEQVRKPSLGSQVLGPRPRTRYPGPGTQDPACGLAPQSLEFSGKKLFAHIEIWICILMRIAHTQCSFGNVQTKLELNNKHVWISKAEIIYKQSQCTNDMTFSISADTDNHRYNPIFISANTDKKPI